MKSLKPIATNLFEKKLTSLNLASVQIGIVSKPSGNKMYPSNLVWSQFIRQGIFLELKLFS
jgi:hypothetical protein